MLLAHSSQSTMAPPGEVDAQTEVGGIAAKGHVAWAVPCHVSCILKFSYTMPAMVTREGIQARPLSVRGTDEEALAHDQLGPRSLTGWGTSLARQRGEAPRVGRVGGGGPCARGLLILVPRTRPPCMGRIAEK